MPKLNPSIGNMYPWVTHTCNVIAGLCQYFCVYCYMKLGRAKNNPFFKGDARIPDDKVNFGKGHTIFIGSGNDMWGPWVDTHLIEQVIKMVVKYPENTYLFQTKNPKRFWDFWEWIAGASDTVKKIILASTIETNRSTDELSGAPAIQERYEAMAAMRQRIDLDGAGDKLELMVSIEPILDFDLAAFHGMLHAMKPDIISIGANSKKVDVPEPSLQKVRALITILRQDEARGHIKQLYLKPNLVKRYGQEVLCQP